MIHLKGVANIPYLKQKWLKDIEFINQERRPPFIPLDPFQDDPPWDFRSAKSANSPKVKSSRIFSSSFLSCFVHSIPKLFTRPQFYELLEQECGHLLALLEDESSDINIIISNEKEYHVKACNLAREHGRRNYRLKRMT